MLKLLRMLLFPLVLAFLGLPGSPLRAAEMIGLEKTVAATFVVRSVDTSDRLLGSAFRFLRNDLVVTNAHVVGTAERVRLVAQDGSELVAEVIGVDILRDVAVLRVPASEIFLEPAENLRLGQVVFALGAPFGADFTLTRGIVSSRGRQIEANVPLRLVQHDAPVNPGSSGGPLVDESGALIGMNSQIADGFRNFVGIAYAISASDLMRTVGLLLKNEPLMLPELGLRLRPVSPKMAAALGTWSTDGALVDSVQSGGLADHTGIQPGDIVLAVAGLPITRVGDLAFALEKVKVGVPVHVVVRRGTARLTLILMSRENSSPLQVSSPIEPARKTSYTLAETGLTVMTDGVVASVSEFSLAHYVGLRDGDVIMAVNGQAANGTAEYWQAILIEAPIVVLVRVSDGSTRHYLLDPWEKPGRLMPVSDANILDESVTIF